MFNTRNGFVLLEATEDGYIELARGNYKEVSKLYDKMQRQADDSIYGYVEEIRSNQSGNLQSDFSNNELGTGDAGNSQQAGSAGLQNNSARNNENLRRGNKGKQSVKFSLPSTDSRGVELIPADVIAVFNPEVIKSVDNLDPTKEKDIEQGEMVEARNKPVAVPKSVKDAPQVECNQAERTNIQGFGIDDIPFAVQTDYIRLTAITYQA